MLANLLDLKVIDFADEAEQKEDIRLFDEGIADKTKGELAETVFARIETQKTIGNNIYNDNTLKIIITTQKHDCFQHQRLHLTAATIK